MIVTLAFRRLNLVDASSADTGMFAARIVHCAMNLGIVCAVKDAILCLRGEVGHICWPQSKEPSKWNSFVAPL